MLITEIFHLVFLDLADHRKLQKVKLWVGGGELLYNEVVETIKCTGSYLLIVFPQRRATFLSLLNIVVGFTYLFLKWQSVTYLLILWPKSFQHVLPVYRDSDMTC